MQTVLPSLQVTGLDHIESIVRDAVSARRIPQALAEDCAQCCMRRFNSWLSRPLSRREEAQLAAYFNAVVRGKVMRSRGSGLVEMRLRLVIRSLAEDLLSAGIQGERVIREVVEALHGQIGYREVEQVVAHMTLDRAS